MATKNQIRGALRKKKKLGLLPPQECPVCKADLSDPDVPEQYAEYREMFGLAREQRTGLHEGQWYCPVCTHTWGRHWMPAPAGDL